MTDPTTDPAHDLADEPQDDEPQPAVRLATVLALLRVLGGERGYAAVIWHAAGFTYELHATREPGRVRSVELDADPTALDGVEARARIIAELDEP